MSNIFIYFVKFVCFVPLNKKTVHKLTFLDDNLLMKKAINLIIMYFVILIAGIAVGTLFYSFYLNVLNFVAGQDLDIWDTDILMESLFFVAITMCFLIFPLLSYYRVRHPGGVPQAITYVLLSIFTMAVLFPATIQLKIKYYDNFPQTTHISHLSGGYFRQSGDKIYYFTKDFVSNPVTGEDTTTIIIDTSENGSVSIEKIKESPDFILYTDADPCKEVLVKNAFTGTINSNKGVFTVLVERAEEAFHKGSIPCIGFMTIALALCLVYAMTSFFNWKLLNAFIIILNSTIILAANAIYQLPVADGIKNALGNNRLMDFFGRYVDEPLLDCFFVILSILFLVVGIVASVVKKHKKKNA